MPIENLVVEAVKMAAVIASVRFDFVFVSRAGISQVWQTSSVERSTQMTLEAYATKLMGGENVREGLLAFREWREPKSVPSKL